MSDDLSAPDRLAIPEGYEPLDWFRGFGRQIGPLYRRRAPGAASTMGFWVQEHHCNAMMNAHGGMLMTLADVAWGHVVSIERSSFWVTVRLTCDFLASARLGEWIEAGSEVLSVEDDVYTTRGRIWTGDRTLMTGIGIFKAMAPRAPQPGEKAWKG
jgi:acyl-coenzyme A thioesterase PaaI-like protein